MKPTTMYTMAALLEEAADTIRKLPQEVFDGLQVRHFLCDELEGSAIMLREYAAELEKPQ